MPRICLKRTKGIRLKDEMLLAALLLVGCLVGNSLVERSEDVASGHRRADIHPSSESSQQSDALRSLALALSSGKEEGLRPFRGSRSEGDPYKDRLNPPIAGMNCYLDRIAIHVSCHSSLVDTEKEAVTLFSRLVDEVQAALPSDRWRGMQTEPGTAWIRNYTYEDQRSNAHIDIDITHRTGPSGQSFYMVSLFAWPH
jgi:hypothetical protein